MCFGLVHLYKYADNYFLENFIGILGISLRVQGCTLPLFVARKFAANYNHEPEGRLVRYRCARVLHVRELHPYNCPCSEGTDDQYYDIFDCRSRSHANKLSNKSNVIFASSLPGQVVSEPE